MSKIKIIEVKDSKSLRQFIHFPWKIYKGNDYWVPPLILDLKKLFNKKKYPFFQHSDADFFIAERDGEIVGRIAAIDNNNHNRHSGEKTGFWGFFESIDDQCVANALLKTAEKWVQKKGLRIIRGPMNYSTNETCGLLTDGFEESPAIMMAYNPQYYVKLIENAGFKKSMDLNAWYTKTAAEVPTKIARVGERVIRNNDISIRQLNMKDFWGDIEILKKIYNDAWTTNWGFVPMTDSEFEFMAKELKPVVEPRMILIAEKEGEPVGFVIALPDFNRVLKRINGRLLPTGIFKLLYLSRNIKAVRVITLGVIKKYQNLSGIGAALYFDIYKRAIDIGFIDCEFSWILGNNTLMNRSAKVLGANLYKRYGLFDKAL